MPIIEVDHVTKEFRIGQFVSLRQSLQNGWARLTGGEIRQRQPFKALNDVSFGVEQGEVVGIIGHNGAGKSTLLKLLAGISRPTRGRVEVRGRVAPLIEVGAGLVPDLTGRENIYLNGTILGMSRGEIRRKFDEIVAFAELEEFIDTPIKRYSSGMKIRLGFSIATSVPAEILIIDEVLAVGDLAFQRKCFDRTEELIKAQDRTVLIVSHNIRQVERLCSRVLMLSAGAIAKDDEPASVCRAFYEKTNQKVAGFHANALDHANSNEWASGEITLLEVRAFGAEATLPSVVRQRDALQVVLRVRVNSPVRDVTFGIGLHTSDFVYLVTDHSHLTRQIPALDPGQYDVACTFDAIPFAPGEYGLRAGIGLGQAVRTIFYSENLLRVQVVPADDYEPSWQEGLVALRTAWAISAVGDECLIQEGLRPLARRAEAV